MAGRTWPSCLLALCVLMGIVARGSSLSSGGDPCVNFVDGPLYTVSEGGNLTIVLELVGGDNTTAVNVTVTPMPESTDYTLSPDPLTLVFTAMNPNQTITVSALTDSILENTESFTLSLNSSGTMIVLDDPATVSIEDNTVAVVEFDQTPYTVVEGQSLSVIVSVMSGVTLERNVVVTLMTVDGSAIGGMDYDSVAGDNITISAGSTSVTVNIMTTSDNLLEGEETFRVTLTTTDGSVELLTPNALVSLEDVTVARVEFSSMDYMVVEGGTLTATVRVMPAEVTVATDVRVNVETVPGSATAGDYTSVNMLLTIMAGGRTATVDIVTIADDVVEGLEMFSLSLSHDEGLVSVPVPTASVSLEDATVARVEFSSMDYMVVEGGTLTATVQVMPAGVTVATDVRVNVETVPGTASAGVDYTNVNVPLTIMSGNKTATVDIVTIADDVVEGLETFSLSLSHDEGLVSVTVPTASVSLQDNTTMMVVFDGAPFTLTEGETVTATVSVSPSTLTLAIPVMVTVMTTVDNATSDDYTVAPDQLTFTSGDPTAELTITAILDTVAGEGNETFTISLTNDSNIQFTPSSAGVAIADATVVIGFMSPSYMFREGETGTAVTVKVVTNPANRNITVTVTSQDGTAVAGEDYEAVNMSRSISSNFNISVTIIEDSSVESDEQFMLSLATDDGGVFLSDPTTTITITDTTIEVTADMPDYSVEEGASVNVTLTAVSEVTSSFTVTLSSSASSEDITFSPESLEFTPTMTSLTVTVTAVTDEEVEGDETFNLTLFTTAMNVALPTVTINVIDLTVELVEFPQSQGVVVGDPVTMTCSYEAGYGIDIEWQDGDGNTIPGGTTTVMPRPGGGNISSSSLTINSVQFDDCGSFRCSAAGNLSFLADLSVVEFLSTSDLNPTLSVGTVAMLSCSITSCGPFTIDWVIYSDAATQTNITNSPVEGSGLGSPLLTDTTSVVTINTVGVINSGTAQSCDVLYDGEIPAVDSGIFNFTLENVVVNVTLVSPNMTSDGSFIQGQDVVFNCTATNPPGVTLPLMFTWVKTATMGRPATVLPQGDSTEGITVVDEDDYSTLTFTNIQDNTRIEGDYMCRVTNRLPTDWVTVTVNVDVISGPVVSFPDNGTVNLGSNLTLECNVESNPPLITVSITLNDDVLVNSTSEPLEYTIVRPQLDDNGDIYKCIAVNEINTTIEKFTLTVRDVPGPVNSSTVVSDLVSLLVTRVTWEPPPDNYDPITEYTLTLCDTLELPCTETTSQINTTSQEPQALFFVVPKYNYTLTITATNGAGDSQPTEVMGIMGAQPGDANVTITAMPVNNQRVILEWELPLLATSPPRDQLPSRESYFNVTGFSVFFGVEEDITPNNTYVFTASQPGNVLFRVIAIYSNTFIDILPRASLLNVNVSEEPPLPGSAIMPAFVSNELDGGDFGFRIEWNEPQLPFNDDYLTGYRVFIDGPLSTSRRKRLITEYTTGADETTYTFRNGIAFTDYTVSVEGVLRVNGEEATVIALAPTELTTADGVSSPPRMLRDVNVGITWARLAWQEPAVPRGMISGYRIKVYLDETKVDEIDVEETDAELTEVINDLKGDKEYRVTVQAMNGAGLGIAADVTFMTDAGATQPNITGVSTNLQTNTYSIEIGVFSDRFGPLSYYEVFVVRSEDSPDTSTLTAAASDDTFIALADDAQPGIAIPRFNFGDGTAGVYTAQGGGEIEFENRELSGGTVYYFFIRLHSSVDIDIFNDSVPARPSAIVQTPDSSTDDNTTTIAVAVVLGILAAILIAILIVILIFFCKGRQNRNYSVRSRLGHLEDGEKGIQLQRRTRHFTPVLDVGDPNAFTSAGQPTTLVCEVSGTPAPTIKWTREGKSVEDDERFLVLADNSLFIQNTSVEDEGTYLVTAENSTGSTTAQIKVTVIKPTPPEPDPNHPPLAMDNFPEYYARLTANDGDELEEEYPDLEPEFASTSYAAKLSINRNKNRYINIIPYDHGRVVLQLQENTPGSDYINASYMNGFKRENQYIATQGPTTTTLADFWRMVWELDCPTIVMVTKTEEEDKKKCEQYWPSYGSTTYGNVQVTLKEAENLAEYSIRTFSVSPLAGQSSAQMPVREVKQFHFLKWPDHGVPNYATALLHFRKRVHNYHPEKRGPMVVHCSAGVGRTGTFITVDYCMERMEGEGTVDIFNFIQQMRYKRNYMVQTPPQYEFLHEAINEAITCGDTSVKAPDLKEWLANLAPKPETGKTAMEEQFTRLESASPHVDDFDCSVAEVNKDKNRTQKHLPSNDQRIVLSSEGDDQCDYICASYVDGYRQRNAFMITQGPMENTVSDFWRMVWELKSAAIVMLTQLEEDGEEMSFKYWSDEVGEAATFGLFHVELTSEVRDLGDYCTRKIKLSPINNPQDSRIVTQFHFTKWSSTVPPESPKPMIDMIDELQRVQRKSGNQPITVHCNNGLGRTGTFCTLYYVLDRVKTEQVVDVFQAVKTLRIQRTGLVENLEQFRFVHTATMEFLNNFSNYSNFK